MSIFAIVVCLYVLYLACFVYSTVAPITFFAGVIEEHWYSSVACAILLLAAVMRVSPGRQSGENGHDEMAERSSASTYAG